MRLRRFVGIGFEYPAGLIVLSPLLFTSYSSTPYTLFPRQASLLTQQIVFDSNVEEQNSKVPSSCLPSSYRYLSRPAPLSLPILTHGQNATDNKGNDVLTSFPPVC
jgi:hypothetical protein